MRRVQVFGDSGRQVMVETRDGEVVEVATRAESWHSWGTPMQESLSEMLDDDGSVVEA